MPRRDAEDLAPYSPSHPTSPNRRPSSRRPRADSDSPPRDHKRPRRPPTPPRHDDRHRRRSDRTDEAHERPRTGRTRSRERAEDRHRSGRDDRPEEHRHGRAERPPPDRHMNGVASYPPAEARPAEPASGSSKAPSASDSLLAVGRGDSSVEDFVSLADRITRRTCRDIGKASQGLAMAIRRIFETKRNTPFLQKLIGAVQGVLETEGLECKPAHDIASALFLQLKVTTDMMNEKEETTLEAYFGFICWVHERHPLPNRCLNPDAKQVFDTVEAKIDTVRVLGGALYTAHVAAYLRRLRDRITQVVLRCSGRDPATFPIGLLDQSNTAEQQQELVEKLTDYCLTTTAFTLDQELAFLKQLMGGESGVAMARMAVSLQCPLTLTRIAVPARSTRCQHLQCFDLRTFLTMACRTDAVRDVEGGVRCWHCPHCATRVSATDLVVSPFFRRLLAEAPADCREVEVLPDLQWRLPGPRDAGTSGKARRSREEVVLSDDD